MSSYKSVERDLIYEESNRMICNNGRKYGFPCKNYKLCGSVLPEWWWECKACYICTNCDISFGTWGNSKYEIIMTGKGILDYKECIDCPVCFNNGVEGMSFPNCNHFVCIPCLKRCVWGLEHLDYPPFPYDNDEYQDAFDEIEDGENPDELEKYFSRLPLLRKYHEENKRIDALNKEIDYKNDFQSEMGNLKICPLCRK